MPIIVVPGLELSMNNSNRYKEQSEGSVRHINEPVQTVLHGVQVQGLGYVATDPPRTYELLLHPYKVLQRGGSSEILQRMESTIIQISNQKNKGVTFQKKGGKQGRSPSSFYQKASSPQTSPIREEEPEKQLEETIFPKLLDSKNPKRFHRQCLQHGQNLDVVQGQRGTKNKKTPFPKEITLSPSSVNALTEIKNSILPLKDIENSLFCLKEINSSLLSLKQIFIQNKKEIEIINFLV
ncbi:hypothetical protein O181_038110 [Austropuccinia psidii MF-1]|uniref:Uncharacterized protein n=1 Tax=Austropuccinia psidii MF-1 TaxID=1389203 RepID=A0A9Q3DCA1_9BASI|nr:hypothetical protein [Austropuccinia psidii MF-1]